MESLQSLLIFDPKVKRATKSTTVLWKDKSPGGTPVSMGTSDEMLSKETPT